VSTALSDTDRPAPTVDGAVPGVVVWVAVALSVVFLKERLVVNQYVGIAVVIGGLLLLALGA